MSDKLKHIAAIAHCGGLVGLSEAEALIVIRKLTVKDWSISGSSRSMHDTVLEALEEAKR